MSALHPSIGRVILAEPLRAALVHTTSQLGHHGCTLVCRQIDLLSANAGIQICSWLPLFFAENAVDWSRYDLVIVNGEGSLHHDRKAARRMAELSGFFEAQKIPAYLINTVYQDNSSQTGAGISRYRRVFVRDSISRGEVEAAGVHANVVPDLSLSWSPSVGRKATQIAISDSTSHETTAELFRLARSIDAPFFSLLTRPPTLPDFPDRNLKQRARYRIRRALYSLLPGGAQKAKIFSQQPDFDSFIRWLANAAFVVAGRFHAVCFCFLLEIPFLALPSNTRKIEGLCADAGLGERMARNMSELTRRLPAADTLGSAAFNDDELTRIRSFRDDARDKAQEMFRSIHSDASGFR